MREGRRGPLVIAAGMSAGGYLIADAVVDFALANPDQELTLLVQDANNVIDSIESGAADVGVLATRDESLGPQFTTATVGNDELVLVAGPDTDLPGQITAAEASKLAFVTAPSDLLRRSTEELHLRRAGIHKRKVVISLGYPEALKSTTRSGVGVSLLFRSTVADDLASGALRHIAIEGVSMIEPVVAFYRTDRHPLDPFRTFTDYLRARLHRPAAASEMGR